ncbi:transcription repressor NadR [Clostridium cellulovorans]|uniref:3H domain-containing protein n=1 Tax=Clostridium cellulovorans (strain ATCC 35296 / DSM 3052 / OCM 3 / 743B) TaxID=573061 RepID=D9SML5_CLOC7|nr:transcription repressor NadR [Clostridium cellulovorans]ADL49800.1 3H domain-containing protein [Clostridium cellulovorans 743B]
MSPDERRKFILNKLIDDKEVLKGQVLAEFLKVTRQIIVKDIAILKAEGHNIISTPKGYMIQQENKDLKKVIAVFHDEKDIETELSIIVKYGGIIEDIRVEHAVYGEITAMLMIKTIYEVQSFIQKLKDSKPLSALTGGVHLHLIRYKDEEMLQNILRELKEKNLLLE